MLQTTNDINPVFQNKSINPALEHFSNLPKETQIRLPLVKLLLGVSRSTVYRLIASGQLKSYKLTERTTTFNCGEIKAFLASKAGV